MQWVVMSGSGVRAACVSLCKLVRVRLAEIVYLWLKLFSKLSKLNSQFSGKKFLSSSLGLLGTIADENSDESTESAATAAKATPPTGGPPNAADSDCKCV